MIKAAIFDMDGTLTDTEIVFRNTWMELAADFGQVPDPEFPKAVCGSNGNEMLAIIRRYYPAVDATDFMNRCLKRVEEKVSRQVPLKAGAKEILVYLKEKGFPIAIASSNTHMRIENNLEKAGLQSLIDVIVGGDDVSQSKPDPEVFITAAHKLGVEPEECYAFEDGMNGLRSCLAAGCKVAMVVDMTEPDDVVAPQCAAVFRSLVEAKAAIEKGEF